MTSQEQDSYPSGEEQLAILAVTNQKYPTPKKYPKPRDSYDHWRVDSWFHRPDALYFHFEYGKHHRESMIEADYFGYRWGTKKEAFLKVDRQSHDMTELTKDEFDVICGSRMNERGIMEWYKDGEWK